MNPRVTDVKPLDNYRLDTVFTNHERRLFDVKPYLTTGIFQELQDTVVFNSARAFNGTVVWPNEIDLDPDTLYLDSQPINN